MGSFVNRICRAARHERVMEVILHGRNLMPPSGGDLTDQQLQDLLRYLHTL
jgi:hypothetical protein